MDALDRLTPGVNPVSGQQEPTAERAYPCPSQCDHPLKNLALAGCESQSPALHRMRCEAPGNTACPISCLPTRRPCPGLGVLSEYGTAIKCQSLGKGICPRGPQTPGSVVSYTAARATPHTHILSPRGGNRAFRGSAPDFLRWLIGCSPDHPTANQARER